MTTADAGQVRDFLARATRRVMLLLMIHGATTGLGLAVIIAITRSIVNGRWTPPGVESLALVVVGLGIGVVRTMTLRKRIATIVESRAPQCKNLLVTASELIESPRSDGYVSDLVFEQASRLASSLNIGGILPARGAVSALLVAAMVWTFAATRHAAERSGNVSSVEASAAAPVIERIDVDISDPGYLGGATRTLHDPARIDVMAGSRVRVTVKAAGSALSLETIDAKQPLARSAAGTFTGEIRADADGFIALEPSASDGRHGARRLIGMSTIADQPPTVRITTPGRDLKFAEGRHTIELAIAATDDHALASLRLRYTRVAGSGERYTFTEGELPLTITRAKPGAWTARASWLLDSLALGPGDMVVYHAVAADGRPGAPGTESDSYIAEVLAPGGIAAAGFAVDPEVERYALSQQMVILKTERLLARKGKMAADSFADAAADIASEQRRVRAEYVFMMGGEVGGAEDSTGNLNEEAEAAGEGDLAVQRMLNEGRTALLSAIRAMSRASTALTKVDVTIALTHERTALAQLERTFAHTKIILRALTERERLDMTRRLSGTLTDAVRDTRPVPQPDRDSRLAALRQALSSIATLAGERNPGAAAASKLAEAVLRIDPAARPLQQVGAQLDSAATAIAASRIDAANVLLGNAATGLTRIMREALLATPMPGAGVPAARLSGALTDALRRPRGTP